jgi:hypothetical protein
MIDDNETQDFIASGEFEAFADDKIISIYFNVAENAMSFTTKIDCDFDAITLTQEQFDLMKSALERVV